MFSTAAIRCHSGPFILSLSQLLTNVPIGNRWETFAVGYCQMEQILITMSARSVYSLHASPPPLTPLCHLICPIYLFDMSNFTDYRIFSTFCIKWETENISVVIYIVICCFTMQNALLSCECAMYEFVSKRTTLFSALMAMYFSGNP